MCPFLWHQWHVASFMRQSALLCPFLPQLAQLFPSPSDFFPFLLCCCQALFTFSTLTALLFIRDPPAFALSSISIKVSTCSKVGSCISISFALIGSSVQAEMYFDISISSIVIVWTWASFAASLMTLMNSRMGMSLGCCIIQNLCLRLYMGYSLANSCSRASRHPLRPMMAVLASTLSRRAIFMSLSSNTFSWALWISMSLLPRSPELK